MATGRPQDAVLLEHRGGAQHQTGEHEAVPVPRLKTALLPLHPVKLPDGKGQDHEGPEQKPRPGKGDGAEVAGADLLHDEGAAPDDGGKGEEEIGLDSSHVLSSMIREELYRADGEDDVFFRSFRAYTSGSPAIRPPYKLEENQSSRYNAIEILRDSI